MGRKSRTTYFDVSSHEGDDDGWVIEGPDALAMFVRRLPSDADGCLLAVLLDADYRVIGCDVVADSVREASNLTARDALRPVIGIGSNTFALVQVAAGRVHLPSRRSQVVARLIGLTASLLGFRLLDYAVVSRRGGYWSAWADGVDLVPTVRRYPSLQQDAP